MKASKFTDAQNAFNEALEGATLSVDQVNFSEMVIDHLTASGQMEPSLLYAPPFTDKAPNGVSDIFGSNRVTRIIETLAAFEPALAEAG